MKVGLLIIASEVLDGKVTDLNTKFLAEFLKRNSLDFEKSITVKDDELAIHQAMEVLLKDCGLIVTSGGLGPTRDDLTKQTIASYLGRTISYSEQAEKIASENYHKFERHYPGKEHGYSFLPEGFLPLLNSSGFAPGLFSEHLDHFIFCAPGVPKEFRTMLEDHLMALIGPKLHQSSFLQTITIRTKRVPEEKIFTEVDKELWDKLSIYGDVASLPVLFGVDICVKLKADSEIDLNDKRRNVLQVITDSPVKQHVWHLGPESLEEVIVDLANRRRITFGFAESCTGGLCSHRITGVSGSSQTFMGSVVCYNSSVKTNILGVKKETLITHGAESSETAEEMCLGLSKSLGVNIAISITGFAGPTGGTPEKPVGTVFIGVCVNGKVKSFHHRSFGDREQLKNRFAQAALMALHEELEKFA